MKSAFHISLCSRNCAHITDGTAFTGPTAWASWCPKPAALIYESYSWNLDFHWEEIKQADIGSAVTLTGPLLSELHWRHNKDEAIKHEVQQMHSEDKSIISLLKTLGPFANPLSPPAPALCFGFLFAGEDEDRVMARDDFLRVNLTMLLNKKGAPASINADVLCFLDRCVHLYVFLSFLFLFASWASDVWFSETTEAGVGFTSAKTQV